MNEELESVMRRIQKLLAIANDDRANANEAASAANMAEKLMRKYQVEHTELITAQLKSSSALSSANVFANMKRNDPKRPPLRKNPPWAQHLAVAVARLNDCEVRQSWAKNFDRMDACLTFYGYDADVKVACFTFDYLVGAMVGAMAKYNKDRRQSGAADKSASEAYRRGFVAAITTNIYVQVNAKQQEMQQASSSRALVVAKKQAITEQFGDFGYRDSKSKAVRDADAFREGVRDGRNVDINRRGVHGNNDNTLKLEAK